MTIDIVHQRIHEGVSYVANYYQSAIPNNEFRRIRIKSDKKNAHLLIEFTTTAKFTFKSYSGTTYTANGTIADGTNLTVFNRVIGQNNRDALVYHNPTVNVLGTLRGSQVIAGGTGGNAPGASGASRHETIIPAGQELLLVFQNTSGQANDLTVILDWYETNPTPTVPIYNLSLSALALTGVAFNEVFNSSVTSYTASVLNAVTSVEITATGVSEDLSTPVVNGRGVKQLAVGANTFYVDVIKFGNYNPKRYTIVVTRGA